MTKTILVVDDEERLVSLLKAYLSNEGFQSRHCQERTGCAFPISKRKARSDPSGYYDAGNGRL